MRLTTIILIATLMQVSAATFGQKLTLQQNNIALKQVFKEIRKQTGYDILYQPEKVNENQKVKAAFKDTPISEVLDQLLQGQSLQYTIKDKTIVITQKESSFLEKIIDRFDNIDIRGRVVDDQESPLAGASVKVKGTGRVAKTDADGNFFLQSVDDKAILVVSYIGYGEKEVSVKKDLLVQLRLKTSDLEEVVVNTGYQSIPKERATGSFVVIDSALLNRKVGTNVMDRLEGIASGLIFNGTKNPIISVQPFTNELGINIRGQNTLSSLVSLDPLIVLDNFPYSGNINNINPNDIESIVVLKDAAATSIWGAKSGNGVIVITTKKGRLNKRMFVEFNTNATIIDKPNLSYDRNFLNSSDYIDAEITLFNKGYYDSSINNTSSFPALSPIVEILDKQKKGLISPGDATNQINHYRSQDVRNDYDKYIYQTGLNLQNSLGIRGGTDKTTYSLAIGYDQNKSNLIRNEYNRLTVNSTNTYAPIKNLEITTAINYSTNRTVLNNDFGYGGSGLGANNNYPYYQFADESGNPLSIVRDYRISYVMNAPALGLLDWSLKPIDEINSANNYTKINDLLLRAGIKYKITNFLNFDVQYQKERQDISTWNLRTQQTYFVRDLINRFSVIDPSNGVITYQFPKGGMLSIGDYTWNMDNARSQFSLNKSIGKKGTLSAILGAELSQQKTQGYSRLSLGYDDEYGTSTNGLNYSGFLPTIPSGIGFLPSPDGNISGTLTRFLSFYSNASYTYDNRYTGYISARKDGSNIFGVKTNDRLVPLWSTGFGWDISNESFYKSNLISRLKLRMSYGYNGNVYNGNAYVTGQYSSNGFNNAPQLFNISAPNPDLHWEKVRNINIGLDFSLKKVLDGTIEFYGKRGLDLVQLVNQPASTGFPVFYKNSASTKSNGIDATLTSKNIDRDFKWNTTLLLSYITNKVTRFDAPLTSNSLNLNNLIGVSYYVGYPIYPIFAYKWAGLNPMDGSPQGYVDGKTSTDYKTIFNNFKPENLVYKGSATPIYFGSLRNDFNFKQFSISVLIGYKLGYYFRRASTTTSYSDVITGSTNVDYLARWQKPGDEKITNVPALTYPSSQDATRFYQLSEILVDRADHIRLQDIRIGYDLTKNQIRKFPFTSIQFYAYATNLGIVWRANKYHIDPDYLGNYGSHNVPNPFQISFGLKASY